MAKLVEESWPEHPLFPAEEGAEPARIEFIQVVRYEHGRALLVPTTFRSGELTSLDAINNMYGGGLYELIGRRCSVHDPTSMGRISAKVRYEIAGPSRPLVVDANAPPPSMPPVVTQVTPTPGAAGMSDQVLIAIMQGQQQAQQNFATMMLQMFQQGRTDQAAMMTTLMQMSGQQQQSMLGMVTAMMAQRGGGTEDIAKIAELFKTLGVLGPKAEAVEEDTESIGGIISNVADIVAGAVELKQGGALPTPPAPPGSAAAVLGAGAKPEPMFEVAGKK
jgi:hypothetical protein